VSQLLAETSDLLMEGSPSHHSGNNNWSRGSQKIDCLRGCGESIILHASTSIARSELLCKINFENHIQVKMLAKSDFCLL
jgi:hypothetical protein